MHIIKHYLVGGFKFRNNLNVAADAADKNNDDDDGIMTITNRKTRTYGIQKHQTQQQKQYKSRRTAASVSSLSKLNSPTSSAANTKPTTMTALNILTTKATTTRLNMSTKNFGLMSIQMILILLVFLLADSGLNGLHVVAALKGKFQHRIPHILDILQKFNNIIPRKQHPHSLLPTYLETNLPDKSLLLCGNLHMFSMFPKNFT